VKLGDSVVGDLEVDEDVRDDSGDVASCGEAGVGYDLHETDFGAAVDEADVAGSEGGAELGGDLAIDGLGAVG
jgi:hypothetical protein